MNPLGDLTRPSDLARVLARELERSRRSPEPRVGPPRVSGAVDVSGLPLIPSDRDFIVSCYRAMLDRAPDLAGFTHFLEVLRLGRPRPLVVYLFANLQEAKRQGRSFEGVWMPLPVSDLLALDGTEFVRQAFRSILWRDPDPASVHRYRREWISGRTTREMLFDIARSEEAHHLPRIAEGLDDFMALMSLSRTSADGTWLASWDERLLDGSIEEFVARAYRLVLGRPVDDDGLRHWGGALRAGYSRRAILLDLLGSPEAIALAEASSSVRTAHEVLREGARPPGEEPDGDESAR